jgi:hypothetical protein
VEDDATSDDGIGNEITDDASAGEAALVLVSIARASLHDGTRVDSSDEATVVEEDTFAFVAFFFGTVRFFAVMGNVTCGIGTTRYC